MDHNLVEEPNLVDINKNPVYNPRYDSLIEWYHNASNYEQYLNFDKSSKSLDFIVGSNILTFINGTPITYRLLLTMETGDGILKYTMNINNNSEMIGTLQQTKPSPIIRYQFKNKDKLQIFINTYSGNRHTPIGLLYLLRV